MANLEAELPFELRSKIFLLCLPLDGRVRPSPLTAPLLLAQVCTRWRAVALATPRLWSSIFFEFPNSTPHHGLSIQFEDEIDPIVDPTTALVDLWFGRCSGFPLSVTIRSCQGGLRVPRGLIEVLKRRFTQWQRLELSLSATDFLELLSVSGPFPHLRSLALDVNDAIAEKFTWNQDLYTLAPDLALFRIGRSLSWKHSFPDGARLSSLKALELSLVNYNPDMFNVFPHIHDLVLRIPNRTSAPSVPVTAHLRSLILDGNAGFLNYLTLPALEHLGAVITDVETANALVSFVTRSRCVLTRLALRSSLVYPDTWAVLLPVAETVSTLELISTGFVHERVRGTLPRGSPLSRLKILLIIQLSSFDSEVPGIYQEFMEFVREQRALRCARLRIHHWIDPEPIPPPGDNILARAQGLIADGMRITLQTPTFGWPEDVHNEIYRGESLSDFCRLSGIQFMHRLRCVSP